MRVHFQKLVSRENLAVITQMLLQKLIQPILDRALIAPLPSSTISIQNFQSTSILVGGGGIFKVDLK